MCLACDLSYADPTKPNIPRSFWNQEANRRKFFIDFAKKMGFDPLVPENWNRVTKSQLLAENVRLWSLLTIPRS